MIRTALTRAPAALLLLFSLASLPAPALADEPVLTRRALELRDGAGDGARSLAALPARAALTRLDGRQGAWVQVRTAAGATGWVHMFDLAPASGAGSDNSAGSSATGALRGVTGLFGGGGVRQAGTTAGIRGHRQRATESARAGAGRRLAPG
jgi:hypothetical protein